jgi:hypothetical protein
MITNGQMKKMKKREAKIAATLIMIVPIGFLLTAIFYWEIAVLISRIISFVFLIGIVTAILCWIWRVLYNQLKDKTTDNASGSDDTQYLDFYD